MNEPSPSSPALRQRLIASVFFAVASASAFVWACENPLQIVWLFGGLLLALGSAFFVAVWQHGFGWLFSRQALRFHAGVVVSLITLLVLFYAEEGWRGKRAWAALQREASARGESLELKSLATPAVPDDQNFAKAPVVAELLKPSDEPYAGGPFYHGTEGRWPGASWALQQFTDLAAWQKFFRNHADNAGWEERRAKTRSAPTTPEPQTPAAGVLTALGKFETNLATLRAASRRPVMRLPLDYGKGFFVMEDIIKPMECLRSAVHLLSLRASAELPQGLSEPALQDVLLALRLEEFMREEPFDYVQRQRRGMIQFCIQPVWEGLAGHRWNGEQLETLQKTLAEVDLLAGYRRGVHGEALAMMSLCDQGLAFAEGDTSESTRRLASSLSNEPFWFWVARMLYPVGWFYQDKAWIYRFYQCYADPLDAAVLRNQPWEKRKAVSRSITDPMLALLILPKLNETFQEGSVGCLLLQTFVQQAATACALERFRLAHGQYPASLEALAPQLLDRVPPDILAAPAAPLKYLPTPDAGFKLWSVGFNRVDDGGRPHQPADPRNNLLRQLSQGNSDLVWVRPGQR